MSRVVTYDPSRLDVPQTTRVVRRAYSSPTHHNATGDEVLAVAREAAVPDVLLPITPPTHPHFMPDQLGHVVERVHVPQLDAAVRRRRSQDPTVERRRREY